MLMIENKYKTNKEVEILFVEL